MSDQRREKIPAELLPVVERLTNERPQPTELELDRIKLRAMSGTSRRASRSGKGALGNSKRIASVAVAAVLVAGGGAVLAKNDPPNSASSSSSSSSSQYCPLTSQNPGNPKPPPGPSKCGKPKP